MRTSTGVLFFRYTAATIRNNLLETVRWVETVGSFRRQLKIYVYLNCLMVISLLHYTLPRNDIYIYIYIYILPLAIELRN